VEGVHAVRELLVAGRRKVKEVWIGRMQAGNAVRSLGPEVEEIVALAEAGGVPLRFVSAQTVLEAARSAAPQGVIAWAEPLRPVPLASLLERPSDSTPPFILVLEAVTDPGNTGSLARSALLAGATGMVLPRHRAALVTPAMAKAAAGAVEHLKIALVPGVPAALTQLSGAGVWSVGLDPSSRVAIDEVELFCEPVALVLGSEGRGLSRLTRQRCDLLASIPQSGPLDSLGVAAAGAVACFSVAQKRRHRRPGDAEARPAR